MWWLVLFISSGTKNWFHIQPRFTLKWDLIACLTFSTSEFSIAVRQGHRRRSPNIKGSNKQFILLFWFQLVFFRGNSMLQTKILCSFISFLTQSIFYIPKEEETKFDILKSTFSHIIVKERIQFCIHKNGTNIYI